MDHAKKLNAIVVLKKSRTEIYCDEETWENTDLAIHQCLLVEWVML